ILATGRGCFQGTFRMLPTAVSQVVEQVVRVAIILTAAYIYTASQWTDYQMGAVAMSSSWIAGLAATLVLGIAFFKKTPQPDLPLNTNEFQQDSIQISTLTKRLMTEGLAICVLSAMLILLQLVDSFTLYKGLIQAGFLPEMAKNVKGIYDRGQPLVQLGMVVATAFSTSLVPVLSRSFS
ncbi:oligosaccharide flippase family protein, partial [Carnobacterium sp.]|uniref:oligosaccharide flippase family protein n=1 Tax=Carnobacterium sp. TaxID=48221 RepID=UPI0028AEF351